MAMGCRAVPCDSIPLVKFSSLSAVFRLGPKKLRTCQHYRYKADCKKQLYADGEIIGRMTGSCSAAVVVLTCKSMLISCIGYSCVYKNKCWRYIKKTPLVVRRGVLCVLQSITIPLFRAQFWLSRCWLGSRRFGRRTATG